MKRAPGYSCRDLVGRDSERGYECVLPRAVIALRGTVKSKTTSREPHVGQRNAFPTGKAEKLGRASIRGVSRSSSAR